VVVMSLKPGAAQAGGFKPTLMGLVSGGMFGLSAIGYRGAILSLDLPGNFVLAATFTLTVGLICQAALLSAWLAWRDPKILKAIFLAWKPSLLAGFMGALASQFWFLGFAIASAASVRTLALVEVLFAQGISKFIFKQPTTGRELLGIAMIVLGVVLLIWAH
jgi:drug/metabolite transporter (DMT)-like permease